MRFLPRKSRQSRSDDLDSGPAQLWRRFWAEQAEAAARPTLPNIANLEAKIDELLHRRLRKLALPPDILALYRARNAKGNRKIMTAWCAWAAIIDLALTPFDLFILPAANLVQMVVARMLVALLFLRSWQLLRDGRLAGTEHFGIIIPCFAMVAVAGFFGLISADQQYLPHYIIMSIVGVATAVMGLRMAEEHTRVLAYGAALLMLGFFAVSNPQGTADKLEVSLFYGAILVALVDARRVQNLYQYRLFLLKTRDEIRNTETSRRNDQLSSLAYTDKLTDLPNRRYFDEICGSVSDATKNLLPLSLCLIDIDHFKNLNDKLGHLRGDRCLRVVAGAIRNNLRGKSDILARYGGEEFVLLLPGTSRQAALDVGERIRAAIVELQHPNPGTTEAVVTISVGVAVATERPVFVELLLGEADRALYRAKESGRNRVCC